MTQFQQELTKYNLQPENLPNYIKRKLNQFEEISNYRQSQIDEFNQLETDDDKEEATEEIESADIRLEEVDEELTEMIREFVSSNQSNSVPAATKQEKGKAGGSWILWGGLGLLGLLVGVNVFKNRS